MLASLWVSTTVEWDLIVTSRWQPALSLWVSLPDSVVSPPQPGRGIALSFLSAGLWAGEVPLPNPLFLSTGLGAGVAPCPCAVGAPERCGGQLGKIQVCTIQANIIRMNDGKNMGNIRRNIQSKYLLVHNLGLALRRSSRQR